MTNEEKARAYDEALERARKMLNMILDNELLGFPDQIREIFPQLKESKDEKIRKEMIRYFTEMKKGGSAALPYDDCIAYLEQKEQKPKIYIPKFRDGDKIKLKGSNLDLTITNIEGSKYYGKGWSLDIVSADESYELVEQKSAEINEYEIIKKHITEDFLSSEVNKRLKECGWYVTDEKPAEWSKEDEKKINFLSRLIEFQVKDDEYCFSEGRFVSKQEAIEMLKSLRPQPYKWYIKKGHWYMCIVDKPEYGWRKGKVYQSPEDNRIETDYKGDLTNWPDSEPWFRPATIDEIPDSQPSWKPSEEQMEALKDYIEDFQARAEAAVGGWNNFDVMIQLYEQLKKL